MVTLFSSYDKIVGYSSPDNIDPAKARRTVTIAKALVDRFVCLREHDKVLVAGCGDGTEAALLCDVFGTQTVGVDLCIRGNQTLRDGKLELLQGNLTELPYPASTFSLIYSYHVLEHVPDHCRMLSELGRVLRPKGVLLIGFPNKKRMLGYVGSHDHATIIDKLRWNLNDYKCRFTRRFENNLGAHAGFTEGEFLQDAHSMFSDIVPVRSDYMRLKYGKHVSVINALIRLRLDAYLFPSNYFICRRAE